MAAKLIVKEIKSTQKARFGCNCIVWFIHLTNDVGKSDIIHFSLNLSDIMCFSFMHLMHLSFVRRRRNWDCKLSLRLLRI